VEKLRLTAKTADRHMLYEAAVQCVEADLDFFSRVFKRKRGRPFRTLKEDFCGTAALAVEWVGRHRENRAWGVDLDRPTLDWGIEHHVSRLGRHADRVTLIEDDVMAVTEPKVEVVCGLNFSYQVFHDRDTLRRYFETAHASLTDDGIFFVDCFGGTEAVETLDEDRAITPERRPDGTRLPRFTYVWEQAEFNIVDHRILCHIHFKFRDGTKLKKAFTYDWRLWTLPELQELMREAGFREVEVYLEGWDDDEDEADGIFRRRTHAENMPGWVGYVVGLR
jgi:cyclopropane fatty-acyl-phospholipid synthase-like methyltransferase